MTKTVLTVDDSPSIRRMIAMTLQEAGYAVMEAVDGQDGLAKALAQPVDDCTQDRRHENCRLSKPSTQEKFHVLDSNEHCGYHSDGNTKGLKHQRREGVGYSVVTVSSISRYDTDGYPCLA